MTKRELSQVLRYWGLKVEGNETKDELETAYRFILSYRKDHYMPVVFPATVGNSTAIGYANPEMVGYGSRA